LDPSTAHKHLTSPNFPQKASNKSHILTADKKQTLSIHLLDNTLPTNPQSKKPINIKNTKHDTACIEYAKTKQQAKEFNFYSMMLTGLSHEN